MTERATCHRKRPAYQDGLCEACYTRVQDGRSGKALGDKKQTELAELHRSVEAVEELGRTARLILQNNLPTYARLHHQAAEIAAAKGDARPAEWALQHVKTGEAGPPVEPPAKTPTDAGLKIMVGVQIGNMPLGAVQGQIVSVDPKVSVQASND